VFLFVLQQYLYFIKTSFELMIQGGFFVWCCCIIIDFLNFILPELMLFEYIRKVITVHDLSFSCVLSPRNITLAFAYIDMPILPSRAYNTTIKKAS